MHRFDILQSMLELNSKQLEPCLQTINTMALQLSGTIEEILSAVNDRESAASTIITFDSDKKESNRQIEKLDTSEIHERSSKLIADLKEQKSKLSGLGEQIQWQVLDFMGLLSLEDVISQRLRHILDNMKRAGNVLNEAVRSESMEEIHALMEGLKSDINKSFTMTAEKENFAKIFKVS